MFWPRNQRGYQKPPEHKLRGLIVFWKLSVLVTSHRIQGGQGLDTRFRDRQHMDRYRRAGWRQSQPKFTMQQNVYIIC